jgi:hypothetical protein
MVKPLVLMVQPPILGGVQSAQSLFVSCLNHIKPAFFMLNPPTFRARDDNKRHPRGPRHLAVAGAIAHFFGH